MLRWFREQGLGKSSSKVRPGLTGIAHEVAGNAPQPGIGLAGEERFDSGNTVVVALFFVASNACCEVDAP